MSLAEQASFRIAPKTDSLAFQSKFMLVLFLRPCNSFHRSTSSIFACEFFKIKKDITACMYVCMYVCVCVCVCVRACVRACVRGLVYSLDVCTDQSAQTVFVWIDGYTYICKYTFCSNG